MLRVPLVQHSSTLAGILARRGTGPGVQGELGLVGTVCNDHSFLRLRSSPDPYSSDVYVCLEGTRGTSMQVYPSLIQLLDRDIGMRDLVSDSDRRYHGRHSRQEGYLSRITR